MSSGRLRERLMIQRNDAPAISVVSITRSSTTASVTTLTAHGFASTDYVTIAGATPSGYNGKVKVTVTAPTTFTYTVNGTLTTPATGTITAVYASNAQGGIGNDYWRELTTICAELIPIRSSERLQMAAIQSDTLYRFRVRSRNDLALTMRCQWTPSWPAGSAQQTLQIAGVLPDGDGRTYQLVDVAKVPV